MKKIVIVDSDEFVYGGQQFIIRIIELLREKYNIHVITLSKDLYSYLKQKNINAILINRRRHFSFLEIRKRIKEIEPDLVILNGQYEAHFSPFLRNKKIIFIRHTSLNMTSVLKRILYTFEGIIFADSIVAVNDFIKDEMFFLIKNKTIVIHNWHSRSRSELELRNKKNKDDKFYLLYCGRLSKEKNVELLIEACKDFEDLLELHIVGTGDEENRLTQKYKSCKNVFFHGFQNYENLYYFYQKADIYISVSSFEGFPLAVLDAFCYGIPVILSDIPGHRNICKNGEYAMLTDLKIEDIKKNIQKLINDESLRQELSVKSLLLAREFSYEVAKEKYINLFESLAKDNHD